MGLKHKEKRLISKQSEPSRTAAVELVQTTIDDNKGIDPVIIDLNGKSSIADHMVIVTGTSQRHVTSLANKIAFDLKQGLDLLPKIEGEQSGDWVLVDAGDIIVHIFRQEVRDFYNLEKMWETDFDKRPSNSSQKVPV